MPEPGVPESFKVLVKELQSLCLDVKVLSEDDEEIEIMETEEENTEAAKDLWLDMHVEETTYGKGSIVNENIADADTDTDTDADEEDDYIDESFDDNLVLDEEEEDEAETETETEE